MKSNGDRNTGEHKLPDFRDIDTATDESERANQAASIAAEAAANAVANVIQAVADAKGDVEVGPTGPQGVAGPKGSPGSVLTVLKAAWKIGGAVIAVLTALSAVQAYITRGIVRTELKTSMAAHIEEDHKPLQVKVDATHDNVLILGTKLDMVLDRLPKK